MTAGSRVADDAGSGQRRWQSPTLAQIFDPRNNALNAWRLVLATTVIFWHSWPLTGRHVSFEPVHQLFGDGAVDGFFAISGFLITWSWFRHPRARDYLVARALRILPGFWVCLIVTAFVIAPIAIAIQGGGASAVKNLTSGAPIRYILANCLLMISQNDIAGTPMGVPWPAAWNGSLWTLWWEAMFYIAIAGLGIVGLLRHRWTIPVLLTLALFWSASLPAVNIIAETPPGPKLPPEVVMLSLQQATARLAVMFLAGALIYQLRNVIPARWSVVAVSVALVIGSSFLPNYRLLGAIPLAYALIVSGALIHHPRLRLQTDLSYGIYIYGFPIQQLLIIAGLGVLAPPFFAVFATLVTLPLAAASWFVVEKPAMRLKARFARNRPAPTVDPRPQ